MDKDSLQKEQTLLKIRDEARGWLDKELQAEKFTDFHDHWMKLRQDDIVSDKYISDHNGYLLALGEYRAHKKALNAIQTASDRVGRATTELDELKKAQGV